MIFEGEVAGVQHMQLRVLHIALERAPASLSEDRIVRAPHQQRWRLILAQVFVPRRILLHVGAIVVEQVDLDAMVLRTRQKMQIHVPRVGTDSLRLPCAFAVNPLHSVRREKSCQRRFGFGCAILPQRRAQRIPNSGEAFLVSVAVLRNDALNPFRMSHRDSEPDWRAIVLNEHRELCHADLNQQLLGYVSQLVEGVGELVGRGSFRVPKARVIRRDQVELVRQFRHQVAIHKG